MTENSNERNYSYKWKKKTGTLTIPKRDQRTPIKSTAKGRVLKALTIFLSNICFSVTAAAPYTISKTTLVENIYFHETTHTIPSNTEGLKVYCYLGTLLPAGFVNPTTWTTLVDPILRIQLNRPEDIGAGFSGNELVTIKVQGNFINGYLYRRVIMEIKDSSGVLYSQNSLIDPGFDVLFEGMYIRINIKTEPFEIILETSLMKEDYFKTPMIYKSPNKYEIGLKEAGEMRIGLVTPFPDYTTSPYGAVYQYQTTFYSLNEPYADNFDSEYRSDMERVYFRPLIPEISEDKLMLHEFDLSPQGDFELNTEVDFLQESTDFQGTKMGVVCVNGCRFVKNMTDQTYQVYIQDGQQIKITPVLRKIHASTIFEIDYNYLYSDDKYQRSYIYWFKLTTNPGHHKCTERYLIYMVGVEITLDLRNFVSINGVKSKVQILKNKWYALGITVSRDLYTQGVNKTWTRMIVQNLSDNSTQTIETISSVNPINSNHERFGGQECGVEAFLKYFVTSYDYLAKPTEFCPFNFFLRQDDNWTTKCVFDLMSSVPDSLKVFDKDVHLARRDHQKCIQLTVKQSGKCGCSPGSSLVLDPDSGDNFCSCNNRTQYYDFKKWECSPCPVNQFVKENKFECEPIAKEKVEFVSKFKTESNQLKLMFKNSTLPPDFIEVHEEGKLKSRFEIEIEGMIENVDFNYTIQFGVVEQKEGVVFLNFIFYQEMDYQDILVKIFSSRAEITPKEVKLKTGPGNRRFSTFGSVSEKVSPESVQITQNTFFLASVFIPSIFEKMPFVLFLFSFLRTLNYYPVKIPENLHNFLSSFYVDYRNTYGYTIVNNFVRKAKNKEDYFLDPPKMKVRNRDNIYISRVLYFSNTVPVISVVSKIGLIWYLVKVFKQLKNATITKISKIEQERKNRSCFQKLTSFVFRKIITFMIIKIHIDIYGRLVFIFSAFGGFSEVLNYNKILCVANILEAILDFTVIVWVEIKIFTFLRGSKTIQLLMLDVQRLKSVLMVNIFKKNNDSSHSATYLCLQNFCIFLLASTLVVFQNFPEMLFLVHIGIMLFLLGYSFLMKNNFRNKIDFFIYFSNNLGFCLIVIMFSFFMYYDEYQPKTVALFGFLIQIGILLLMLSKLIFLFLKFLRMYLNWRERRRKGSAVKNYVRKKRELEEVKKKKKVRPPTYDELENVSSFRKRKGKKGNSNGSSSQLFRFVMTKNLSRNFMESKEELDKNQVISEEGEEQSMDKPKPEEKGRLSIKLRRQSIRSKRNSVMSISTKLKGLPKKSSYGVSHLSASPRRKRRKSNTFSPGSKNETEVQKLKKKEKSSLKEIDDELFDQLQKIHDDELKKRGTKGGGNLNRINSKGTFSSHSSEYFDEESQRGKNSIMEQSFKLQKQTSNDIISPLGSPKNLRTSSFGGFTLMVNNTEIIREESEGEDSKDRKISKRRNKFAPSLDDLNKIEFQQKNRKINIAKKSKLIHSKLHKGIMMSRIKRNSIAGMKSLKDRIQLRRGSLRLNFKEEPVVSGGEEEKKSRSRRQGKLSTFSSKPTNKLAIKKNEKRRHTGMVGVGASSFKPDRFKPNNSRSKEDFLKKKNIAVDNVIEEDKSFDEEEFMSMFE